MNNSNFYSCFSFMYTLFLPLAKNLMILYFYSILGTFGLFFMFPIFRVIQIPISSFSSSFYIMDLVPYFPVDTWFAWQARALSLETDRPVFECSFIANVIMEKLPNRSVALSPHLLNLVKNTQNYKIGWKDEVQ